MAKEQRGQTIWNDCGASPGSGLGTDFDNQMATFHFLVVSFGSKHGPLLKRSPDGSTIPHPSPQKTMNI
jgi:hypothetical protein